MISRIWHNTTYRFLILFLGIFALLYYFQIAFIGVVAPGNIYVPFLAEHLNYIEWLRYGLMQTSASIIRVMGEQVFTTETWFRVVGRGGFVMAYDCLGYGVMSFFTAFVVAFPKSLKSKLWFLPAGLLLIQTLNVIRFVFLGLYWRQSDLKTLIDHHDLFNIVLYIVLMIVLYFWVNSGRVMSGVTGKVEKIQAVA